MKKILIILTLIVIAITTSCTDISEPNTIKNNITNTKLYVIEIDK